MAIGWSKEFSIGGMKKKIQVICGDIADQTDVYDLLICSAFKGKYKAYKKTLIGGLAEKRQISVLEEAKHPFIDCREEKNYWVSDKLESNFIRLGCVEILSASDRDTEDLTKIKILTESFSTVYDMLEDLSNQRESIKRIILPVLGSGNQGIELCYIVPPLIKQSIRALTEIKGLEEIVFCEFDQNKASELISILSMLDFEQKTAENEKKADVPEVFLSYCSAQRETADRIRNKLINSGVNCWMAPYSIPAGSNYQKEIPIAISQVSTVLLVLSEEAENSLWVQKEVGSAIGARRTVVPYRSKYFKVNSQFGFMLGGVQIFDANQDYDDDMKCQSVTDYVSALLGKENKVSASQSATSQDLKSVSDDKAKVEKRNTDAVEIKEAIAEKTDMVLEKRQKCKSKKEAFSIFRDCAFIGIGLAITFELGMIIKKLSDK